MVVPWVGDVLVEPGPKYVKSGQTSLEPGVRSTETLAGFGGVLVGVVTASHPASCVRDGKVGSKLIDAKTLRGKRGATHDAISSLKTKTTRGLAASARAKTTPRNRVNRVDCGNR